MVLPSLGKSQSISFGTAISSPPNVPSSLISLPHSRLTHPTTSPLLPPGGRPPINITRCGL
ncbi:hypothetical protein ACSBR2_024301 [Camellia fascicularis]